MPTGEHFQSFISDRVLTDGHAVLFTSSHRAHRCARITLISRMMTYLVVPRANKTCLGPGRMNRQGEILRAEFFLIYFGILTYFITKIIQNTLKYCTNINENIFYYRKRLQTNKLNRFRNRNIEINKKKIM